MIRILMYGPEATSGGVATHTKNLIEELEKLDVIIISHCCSGSIFKKMYQRTVGLFFKSITKKKEYDIIHIQTSGGMFSFISAITGTIISQILNKKLVITFHYSKVREFITKYKPIFQFVLDRSNKFILVSNKQKEAIFSEFEGISKKIIVIPNGFKSDLFYHDDMQKCRRTLNLPENKKIILTVGNLLPIKGHKDLIDAISKIIGVKNNILSIIIGEGDLHSNIKWHIHSLDLDIYVIITGAKSNNEIPLWMNAADLFVLPSLNEGNPTVMFEALGCGTPFVGTKVGGVPEIITSDTYGLLVEPGNPEDLADKILIALEREWDREAIRKYAEQFTWENIANDIISIYKQVLI